jgi:hypothetical protein
LFLVRSHPINSVSKLKGSTYRPKSTSALNNRARQGELEEALKRLRASLAIRWRLTDQEPSNVPWQDELGVSHAAIGDVLTQQSSFAGALESYRKAMGILETFSTARKGLELDPSSVLIKTNLAHGYLFSNPLDKAKAIYLVQVHATFFAIACLRCSTYLHVK